MCWDARPRGEGRPIAVILTTAARIPFVDFRDLIFRVATGHGGRLATLPLELRVGFDEAGHQPLLAVDPQHPGVPQSSQVALPGLVGAPEIQARIPRCAPRAGYWSESRCARTLSGAGLSNTCGAGRNSSLQPNRFAPRGLVVKWGRHDCVATAAAPAAGLAFWPAQTMVKA